MGNKMAVLLLVSLTASGAFGGLEPDYDSLGIYFDTMGSTNCSNIGPFQPTPAYLLLMNPRSATNGFAVGAAANYPVVSGACVLVSYIVMLQAMGPLEFRITQASIPSLPGGLPVVTGDGVLRRCGVSSGDVALPVAGLNPALCAVSDEIKSFGAVKSLFR